MTTKKSDWTMIREAESEGHMVAMTGLVERIRTPLNNELSDYFRQHMPHYTGVFEEDETEDILDVLNEYLKENTLNKPALAFPHSSGSELYLIPITQHIQLKVLVVDEYHGSGEYEKYIMADFFWMTEHTTKHDVDTLIRFIEQVLTI